MSTARTACPECDGRLRADGDETVCGDCGLVVAADRLDRGPEWRTFSDDDTDPRRTGAPLTRSRHDRGLSTEIGRSRVKGRKRKQWARMRRQHTRARISTKRERNQVYGFTEIRRLTSNQSLGDRIRDQACSLFQSAQKENLLRGRSIEGFAAAAVYAACRVAGISRTRGELLAEAKADEDELRAAYDALNRDLGLPVGPIDPVEYLPRFASELDLGPEVERVAREYLERARDRGIVNGRNPGGVAAACLYAAARDAGADCTQAGAAAVADVTPVTLRNSYADLQD
ncbi:transcription initiation factor IIB [Halorarum salinum]|uniref:Transcription initiation factor IIB n=1 Tax=Halorarum salinum TaxID=2743089 RepID=A0A7D5QED3_9EURY|nr:transcription initiation factor IIB family protein [Halobaculum salinum]QLG60683.1 transcription initiation factor IIB family protein [Halobaculum salinum]